MPDFYDLMFEVSNEERVRILEAIMVERSSFSGLARRLDITPSNSAAENLKSLALTFAAIQSRISCKEVTIGDVRRLA